MTELLVRTVFSENLALTYFLGICTFLAISQRVETAFGLGLALTFVQSVTVPLNYFIHTYLLSAGALAWVGLPEVDLGFLKLITAIGVIAAVVQVVEMVLERYLPVLHRALGSFLPLITVNCAILGGSLFAIDRKYDLTQSVFYGVGSGVGWMLAIVTFSAIRERMRYCDIPRGLEGLGIAFIVTGLMSLGFAAFAGVGGR